MTAIRSVDWLGVPLRSKQIINGVIAIQTYDTAVRISEQHKDILAILAAQVSSAIERFLGRTRDSKIQIGYRPFRQCCFHYRQGRRDSIRESGF